MNFVKTILTLFITLSLVTSCSSDEEMITSIILSDYLETKNSIPDDVIACAASSKNKETIFVYFFPETNTSEYRLYLLPNSEIKKTEFDKYELQSKDSEIAVANTIRAFELENSQEEVWAIVSFEKENEIHYSNPINLKHKTSATIYDSDVMVDTSDIEFTWKNTLGVDETENAIYFEIINDENNDLISGTYTYENNYTYLDNSNVVLTITPENMQQLETNTNYSFIVMGVSEDNWVNFISDVNFTLF